MRLHSVLKHSILLALVGAPAAFASSVVTYDVQGVALAGNTGDFANLGAGDAVDLTFTLDLSQYNGSTIQPTNVSFSDYGGSCCGGGPTPLLIAPSLINAGVTIGPSIEPFFYVNDQLASDLISGASNFSLYSSITDALGTSYEFALNIAANDGSAFSPTGALPVFNTQEDTGTGLVYDDNSALHYDFNSITVVPPGGVHVPEPLTASLLGLGILATRLRRRRLG